MREHLIWALMLMIIICLVLVVYIYYENRHFRTVQYKMKNSRIPKEFNSCKLAFLSDLHGYEYGENNKKLVDEIKKQQPDYILIGGDMFVKGPKFQGDVVLKLLTQLVEIAPVYYANGNHELQVSELEETKHTTYPSYEKRLHELGVVRLVNDSVQITRGRAKICLTGLDLDHSFYRKFQKKDLPKEAIHSFVGEKSDQLFTILLAHNPVYFEEYSNWGADLVFSGHVHGGMIALPIIGGLASTQGWLFPKYDFGQFEHGDGTMILSRGLGNHTINIRINNSAELVIVELDSMNK